MIVKTNPNIKVRFNIKKAIDSMLCANKKIDKKGINNKA
jgi:hypothetical protein